MTDGKRRSRREAPAKINLALDILGQAPGRLPRALQQSCRRCPSADSRGAWRRAGEGFTLSSGGLHPAGGAKDPGAAGGGGLFRPSGPGRCRPPGGAPRQADPGLRGPGRRQRGRGGAAADPAETATAPEMPRTRRWRPSARTVGSDMPFCLRGGTCPGGGPGRDPDGPAAPAGRAGIVLCKPAFGHPHARLCSPGWTAVAIRHRPDIAGDAASPGAGGPGGRGRRGWATSLRRCCRRNAGRSSPSRDALLAAGALGAAMSGSGPTVFGHLPGGEPGPGGAARTLPLGESYAVRPLGKLT